MRGEIETAEELRASALLERELGCALDRIETTSVPTVDYRTPDRRVGIEVKRVTNEVYNDLTSAFGKAGHFDSSVLSGRWTVMIDRPALSTTLDPMPRFHEDDLEQIVALEAQGLIVQRKAQREAQWRADHPGPKLRSPRLAKIGQDLEPHLAVLERHGIGTTSGLSPYFEPEDLAAAVVAINQRTRGGICDRHDLLREQTPGVDVALATGYVRTERANTMAGRIDLWLASDLSNNLRQSLANEPAGTERHAVLVFDAHTEPEYRAARDQGPAFCPTAELCLPAEVDVLWSILGPVACRYSAEAGWRSVEMPEVPGVS